MSLAVSWRDVWWSRTMRGESRRLGSSSPQSVPARARAREHDTLRTCRAIGHAGGPIQRVAVLRLELRAGPQRLGGLVQRGQGAEGPLRRPGDGAHRHALHPGGLRPGPREVRPEVSRTGCTCCSELSGPRAPPRSLIPAADRAASGARSSGALARARSSGARSLGPVVGAVRATGSSVGKHKKTMRGSGMPQQNGPPQCASVGVIWSSARAGFDAPVKSAAEVNAETDSRTVADDRRAREALEPLFAQKAVRRSAAFQTLPRHRRLVHARPSELSPE